jgi:DNA ligase-1
MIQHGKVLPRQVGNGMFNKILNEGEPEEDGLVAVYDAWDMIPLSEVKVKNKYKVKYSIRFQKLIDAVKSNAQTTIRIIDYKMVYSIKEAYEHYKECLEAGLEGTVVKNPYAIWEDGTSGDQVKLKLEAPCELEIVSFNPGNGKNAKTFGSINCKSSDGKVVVRVPGTSDEMRDYFHANRDSMPGKIITVKSNFLTPPSGNKLTYSLFLPVFLEERKDKHEADSLERIIEQFEAAIRDVTDME